MLQQGLNVADVCYFIGEDTPKMTGITQPVLPKGYQFDYINAEVILRDMTVKDGMLTLPHGTSYRMLVLPELKTMRPGLLAKIKQLVADGGVILGPRPERSPSYEDYPHADEHVRDMAGQLWGDVDGVQTRSARFGKGLVLNGMDMAEALATVHCLPDCALEVDLPVVYCHRRLPDADIYFLANQSSEKVAFSPVFRVSGRQPELWNPATGTCRTLNVYEENGETTAVPLELEPLESAFVVFKTVKDATDTATATHAEMAEATGGSGSTNYPEPQTVAVLSGPWTLTFDSAQRGPATPVVTGTLFDWSTSEDDAVRYYSGKVIYQTEFDLPEPAASSLFINLGDVMVMAKVKVNGKEVGGVWTAPYRLDISDAVQTGNNRIEVSVVNTWMNRLIGDSALAPEERPTWSPCNPWNVSSPLQKSGLLGPVSIEAIDYKK
ncbi:glycosyl hydrolase, partial [uncultured Bacteroides sp.]